MASAAPVSRLTPAARLERIRRSVDRLLHLLGIDPTRLTYHYSGRDFRLTDVYGQGVKNILA